MTKKFEYEYNKYVAQMADGEMPLGYTEYLEAMIDELITATDQLYDAIQNLEFTVVENGVEDVPVEHISKVHSEQ